MDYRAAGSRRRAAASSAAKRRRQQHPLGRQGDVRTVMMASSHDEDPARCTICQRQPHQFEECREVWHMSVARRREEVRRLGLCYACMRPGHRAFDCEANCTACGRRHHVMLHEMRDEASASKTSAPAPRPPGPSTSSGRQPRDRRQGNKGRDRGNDHKRMGQGDGKRFGGRTRRGKRGSGPKPKTSACPTTTTQRKAQI